MATVNKFEDLEAWKIARGLTREIYDVTGCGPFSRDFGLRDQLRRASVSVMANISEGFESRTDGLFIEFLGRAKGSAGEVRSHLCVALDAGYVSRDQFCRMSDNAHQMSRCISGLMSYLKAHRLPINREPNTSHRKN